MKLSQISLFLGMSVLLGLPVFGQDYSVIILPNSSINPSQKTVIGDYNCDEALTTGVISNLKKLSKNAPELAVLKKDTQSLIITKENLKSVSDIYEVKKILIIGSEIDSKTSLQQRSLWQKLDVPIITQPDISKKIVTSVSLINAETNEVIWSNLYYKNIVPTSKQSDQSDLKTDIEKYYELLAIKISEDISKTNEINAASSASNKIAKEVVSKQSNKDGVIKVPLKKVKPEKVKVKNPKPEKTAKIKENKTPQEPKKLNIFKLKKETKKEDVTPKKVEEISAYNTFLNPEDVPAATRYLQLRPRINSRRYTPDYNVMINEI